MGVLLLGMIMAFMVFNISRYEKSTVQSHSRSGGSNSLLRKSAQLQGHGSQYTNEHVWIPMNAQEFNQDAVAENAEHLVVVAGHSVAVAGNLDEADQDESVWYLLDYQKGAGMPQAIVGHIAAGLEEAHSDPDALLVLSGGQTRPRTGPLSEGASYYQVADALRLWPKGSTVRARTVAEEYATDSFQNL